jgi:hypothetical protein
MSCDSSVSIALGYGLDDRDSRVRFPAGAENFPLHHHVQNGSGAHPASYPMGPGSLSLGVKWPGREADHSPPSSAEVNEWVDLYLHPQYDFMARSLVKHRDNFTFSFYSSNGKISSCRWNSAVATIFWKAACCTESELQFQGKILNSCPLYWGCDVTRDYRGRSNT